MAAHLDAQIWAVIGASGSGKGVWIKGKLRELRPRRMVVWDRKGEYEEFATLVPSIDALRAAMLKAGDGPLCVRFRPTATTRKGMEKQFSAVCELVAAWGNCVFVAEELSNVTQPSWAPPAWQEMTTGGRHEGVHIIGTTQTPTIVDKSFLGNATLIHCGPLRRAGHRAAMAEDMDMDPAELAALLKFQWVEKDFETGEIRSGTTRPDGAATRAAPARGKAPAKGSPSSGGGASKAVGKRGAVAPVSTQRTRKPGVKS